MQEYWDKSIFYNIIRMHSDSNTLLHVDAVYDKFQYTKI